MTLVRNWLLKRIRNVKFKTKILALIWLTAMIPTIILFTYTYKSLISVQSARIDELNNDFEQQVNNISQRIAKAMSNTLKISTNAEIQTFFSTYGDKGDCVLQYVTVIRPLLTYMRETSSPEICTLRFYTNNTSIFSNLTIQNVYKLQDLDFLDSILKQLKYRSTVTELIMESRNYYGVEYSPPRTLSVFASILTTDNWGTYIECELSFDEIYQNLSFATNGFSTTDYFLLYKTGDVLFSSNDDLVTDALNTASSMDSAGVIKNRQVMKDGKTYILNASKIDYINCVLISYSDLDTILAPIRHGRILYFLVIVACVASGYVITNALVNKLLRRVDMIDAAIQKIQGGDFNIHLEVSGNDFIDKVSANLNNMAQQILNLIQVDYQNKLMYKNLEIQMLTQQISPHFLFNTLECLKMRAILENKTDMAHALTSLGRLLRYYANYSSEMSTVQNELERIKDYVNVIKLIEERRCDLEMEVEPSLLSQKMPSFILQPLVENSIKHGSTNRNTDIMIKMSVRRERGHMLFTIQDNGIGVKPEQLNEIQAMLAEVHVASKYGNRDRSIGLYNTNARMKLIYGEDYGIAFESEYGKGTTIKFEIPVSE